MLLLSCAALFTDRETGVEGPEPIVEKVAAAEGQAEAAGPEEGQGEEALQEGEAEEPEEEKPAEYAEHAAAPDTPEAEETAVDLLALVLEDKLPQVLGSIEVMSFIESLESDRLLLVEIRKQVPENRLEAEIYLNRLKMLSSESDPVRLVPLIKRVLDNAPIYFDWLDTEFESPEEEVAEYYIGGARGFHFALEEFRSAVMFAIVNRLEIAARVIRDLETELLRLEEEE
jgi:hypothetical protein